MSSADIKRRAAESAFQEADKNYSGYVEWSELKDLVRAYYTQFCGAPNDTQVDKDVRVSPRDSIRYSTSIIVVRLYL